MSRAWNPTRSPIPATLLLLLLSGPAPAEEATPTSPVQASRLRQHVEFLASDRLQGRETGEKGCRLAEEYIRDTFVHEELAPYPGIGDYFADFELQRAGFDMATSLLTLSLGDDSWQAEAADDFRPFSFSASGHFAGDVVFAGYGITAEEHGWDDYAGLDVTGKIVVVLRYEPGKDDPDSPFDGTRDSPHAYFTAKERNARTHGAIGMWVVQGPMHRNEPRDFPFPRGLSLKTTNNHENADDKDNINDNDNDEGEPILSLQVRSDWLQRALRPSSVDLRALQEQIEAGVRPAELQALDLNATVTLERTRSETIPARNVVAYVPGADPHLSRELIVVGAHHDHVGLGFTGRDRIFNGADDNASGTALLLELARAWKQRPIGAARSVVFVTFTAEEKGLLGSRALVQSGLLPLDRVRFMINLDMVGRNADRPIQVMSDPRAQGLQELIEQANHSVDLPLSFDNEGLSGNSDHASFHNEDIPVLFFFTGTHDDYHRPGDHADKLEYARMADIGTLSFGLLEQLATLAEEDFPSPRHDVYWMGAQLSIEATPAGLQAAFTTVEAESPAQRAGLRVGDVLVAIDGTDMRDNRHAGTRLQNVEPEQRVELSVRRFDTLETLWVQRAHPGFLGIGYAALSRQDRQRLGIAPGEGVLVQRVLPQGPAADAGLRAGDIILRIADEPASHRDLAGRIQAVGARNTVEMDILRDGETLQRKVRLAALQPTG